LEIIEQPIAGNDSLPSVTELPRDAAESCEFSYPMAKGQRPPSHQ